MATSSEDFIASDAVEDREQKLSEDLNCTLCLKVFRSPRRLPCSHSFCHDCLQSHISSSASVKGTSKEFRCPICETVVTSVEEISLDKWVYLFPHNTLLLSVLMKLKVKVDFVCDVCQGQDLKYPAKELRIVCEKALCRNCSKMHKYIRLLNTHDIIKVEELSSKQAIVLQHNSVFKCVDHAQSPLGLYCKTHEIQLCSQCFASHHKSCSKVVVLINVTSNISDMLNDIKVQIKRLEDQFKRVTDNNMSNLRKLDSQVNDLTEEIRGLKQSINNVLDDLETRVKNECQQIYNDERNKLEQLNLGFKSQIMSIRNSNFIIDSVSKVATQSQMFLLVKRMLRQLSLSKSQIEEKYMENNTLKLELDINPQLTSIMSMPRGEIAEMKMIRNNENPVTTAGFKSPKGCNVEAVDVKEMQVHGDKNPWYTDVKYISHDLVMLVDNKNNVCHLLDSLFNSVCFYELSGSPSKLCTAGESEIAVSMPLRKTIQLLLVTNSTITPIRTITTRHTCYGIASVGRSEMIVSGPCGDGTYYWSHITLDGREKSYHVFHGIGRNQTYVALNARKTSLYISVNDDDSLHCFGLDGKKYFTFKHQDLKGPQAVAIDRDDNVYVVGDNSGNIFQLSAYGVLIQTITNIVPKNPTTMCFNEDGDRFIIICYKKKDIHVFRLAFT